MRLQHEKNDPRAEYIHRRGLQSVTLHDFWSHVPRGAAALHFELALVVADEPQIDQFRCLGVVLFFKHDVLQLDISVKIPLKQ